MKESTNKHLEKLADELANFRSENSIDIQGPILTEDGRNLAAVLLGRRGGLKGGRARAASLSSERRKEIASKAAKARWGHNGKKAD